MHNVPYFRGLDVDTIRPLTFLMKQQVYDQGDLILAKGQFNKSILILWEGELQVRVSRKDPSSDEVVDIWLDNLRKGTCIEVYNCF